jgi:hypothetical protein
MDVQHIHLSGMVAYAAICPLAYFGLKQLKNMYLHTFIISFSFGFNAVTWSVTGNVVDDSLAYLESNGENLS